MTVTQTTVYTCNICGRQEVLLAGDRDCFGPARWPQVEWSEPPLEGEVHRQWKKLDLCPDHLNLLLKWVTEQQEKSRLSR